MERREENRLRAWRAYGARDELQPLSRELIDFMSSCKTEREACAWFEQRLLEMGSSPLERGNNGRILHFNWHDRALLAIRLGAEGLKRGMRLVASHSDSPRLDLKPLPFFEDENALMADTQYYGGIKSYQWANVPLAIHGVVYRSDGSKVHVQLGEGDDEPIFLVPDLAPHLDRKLSERKASEAIKGEKLDVLVGGMPADPDKGQIKAQVLEALRSRYGISEEDFMSAEVYLVPAFKAREVGFDRAFLAAYGMDDRACSFLAFKAFSEISRNTPWSCAFLSVDKEEIGSEGISSAQSALLEVAIREMGYDPMEVLSISEAISADVTAAVDPSYKDVYDPHNSARLGNGVAICKYTGGRGKSYGSEAPAEFVAKVRGRLERRGVPYQPGILGKVDEGGGGTIAKFLARLGMRVLDMGLPLLSMHSPMEIASKADVFATKEAFLAFYEED